MDIKIFNTGDLVRLKESAFGDHSAAFAALRRAFGVESFTDGKNLFRIRTVHDCGIDRCLEKYGCRGYPTLERVADGHIFKAPCLGYREYAMEHTDSAEVIKELATMGIEGGFSNKRSRSQRR